MILDSLLVALGYEYDAEGLEQLESSLDDIDAALNKAIIGAIGLATAFVGVAVASAQSTDELTKQAREIDIAAGELDAYNFAAEQTIGTSAGVADSLKELSLRASEAARGTGSGVEAFGLLGISVTDAQGKIKGVNELFLESADALNALDNNSQRIELANKLGLQNLNLLLQEGSEGIATLVAEAKTLGVVTDEQSIAAEQFNDSWNRLTRVVTTASRELATDLLPVLEEIVTSMKDWILENKVLIKSGIDKFLETVGFILNNIQLILIAIISLKVGIWAVQLAIAMQKLGKAALLLQVRLFAIMVAIGLIIAAVILVIQDFITFQKGGESAIGILIEKFKELKDEIKKSVNDWIEETKANIKNWFDLIGNYTQLVKDRFTSLKNNITGVFADIGLTIENTIQGWVQTFDDFIEGVVNGFKNVGSFFGIEVNKPMPETIANPASSGGAIGRGNLSNALTNNNSNKVMNVGTLNFNVDGNDPARMQIAVQKVIDNVFGQAAGNIYSGG